MTLRDDIKALRGEIRALRYEVDRLSGLPAPALLTAATVGNLSLPKFWPDRPIREAVIDAHRQMTISELRDRLTSQFGAGRAPSRSSIGRFWQRLDQLAHDTPDRMSAVSAGEERRP